MESMRSGHCRSGEKASVALELRYVIRLDQSTCLYSAEFSETTAGKLRSALFRNQGKKDAEKLSQTSFPRLLGRDLSLKTPQCHRRSRPAI